VLVDLDIANVSHENDFSGIHAGAQDVRRDPS
jgi:hypothetical protein